MLTADVAQGGSFPAANKSCDLFNQVAARRMGIRKLPVHQTLVRLEFRLHHLVYYLDCFQSNTSPGAIVIQMNNDKYILEPVGSSVLSAPGMSLMLAVARRRTNL